MKFYKYCYILSLIIICLVTIFMINTYYKASIIDQSIIEFKNRGVFYQEFSNFTYYKVYPKYDYEDVTKPVIRQIGKYNYGYIGDIFTSAHDPMHGSDFLAWFSLKAWIGHSGIVYDSNGYTTLEITYNNPKPEYNRVRLWENDWALINSPKIVGLRVKGLTDENREVLVTKMDEITGNGYNNLFVFQNNKKYYCSSLISYLYRQLNINLDSDGFVTMGSDFLVSQETYLIFYSEMVNVDGKTRKNVYFLCEEDNND